MGIHNKLGLAIKQKLKNGLYFINAGGDFSGVVQDFIIKRGYKYFILFCSASGLKRKSPKLIHFRLYSLALYKELRYSFKRFLFCKRLITHPFFSGFKNCIGHGRTSWRQGRLAQSGRVNAVIHEMDFNFGHFG